MACSGGGGVSREEGWDTGEELKAGGRGHAGKSSVWVEVDGGEVRLRKVGSQRKHSSSKSAR